MVCIIAIACMFCVTGFARLVSSVYAGSLLTLLMRVQLSITGGQMYREVHSQQQQHSTEINKQFLSYFLQQGEFLLLDHPPPILPFCSLVHFLSCNISPYVRS